VRFLNTDWRSNERERDDSGIDSVRKGAVLCSPRPRHEQRWRWYLSAKKSSTHIAPACGHGGDSVAQKPVGNQFKFVYTFTSVCMIEIGRFNVGHE